MKVESVCTSERGKNPNKSNVQRVDSALRARGSFSVGRFAVYRGRPVTPGSSEVGANAGSEVGRERWLGVFLQGWNNGASYQRQKEIETDTEREREAGAVVKAS